VQSLIARDAPGFALLQDSLGNDHIGEERVFQDVHLM